MGLLISIIFGLPGFALAIMVHEAAHAWAALKLGDPTARNQGRISLDPRRHIDPFGVLVYLFTIVYSGGRFAFGWAKPVPINRHNFRDPRRDFMLSALAGPAANLIQALLWAVALRLYLASSDLPSLVALSRAMSADDPIGYMIFFGMMINVVLAVFNLIPIPPLDGSRLLAWLLPEDLAWRMDQLEPFGFVIVLVLLWLGLLGAVFHYVGYPLLELYLRLAVGI